MMLIKEHTELYLIGDSSPLKRGAISLGISPPGSEYPRNIAPRGENALGMLSLLRKFAPHINFEFLI
jgi:hypothetical protein